MKKLALFSLGAIVAGGVFFTSCTNGVSVRPTLRTEADSISYAYGANLYSQGGLNMFLEQQGLIGDTIRLRASYQGRIEKEQDVAKKEQLTKEMNMKIDSVSRANTRNIADFLRGVQESMNAPESKNAYTLGQNVGGQLSKQMFPQFETQFFGAVDGKDGAAKISDDAFLSGLATAMSGRRTLINQPDLYLQEKGNVAQKRIEQEQQAKMQKQYGDNLKAGQDFLAANKVKEGVVTLPSGLQYKVIKAGDGPKPVATDRVKVSYRGTLIDGTEFDSSPEQVFGVTQVIPGWIEALQLMPVGSKWEIYVPDELAYGQRDMGAIKPFSTLVFEIELFSIEK